MLGQSCVCWDGNHCGNLSLCFHLKYLMKVNTLKIIFCAFELLAFIFFSLEAEIACAILTCNDKKNTPAKLNYLIS